MDGDGFGVTRELLATKAEDIMGPPYSVALDDDLEKAMKLAVQDQLHDIPVVENDKIVGNLDCLEIIVNYRSR